MNIKYNIFLNGKLKMFEGTEEKGYLLSDYMSNDFPTKTHRLVINDRIRPSKIQLIERKEEWDKEVMKIFGAWNREKVTFDSRETKEDLFEECNNCLGKENK